MAAPNDGAKEFTVRVPRISNKKFSIMKLNPADKVDFTKCDGVKLERENNLKQYKVANDIEVIPQFGAGSEYGRDQKQEARRKKFGISKKSYSPEDQPWLLKLGSGKTAKKFKGVKEGGVTENTSYFVFKQSADGAFEAFPLHEWYNFTPLARYKRLNAEEAEEQFTRRDKTLNFFSIMVNKRLKKEEETGGDDGEEGKGKAKKEKKDKDFYLTELDEWQLLDSDGDGSEGDDSGNEKKKKPAKKTKKRKLAKRKGSDGEAEEESDDVDEGREVDYMTDTDSEDEDMYTDNVKTDKYEEKGVEDADGLKTIIQSDEDEEEKKEENEDEEEEDDEQEEQKKEKKESDSNDSSSGSDSDLDKDENIMSAVFMQKREKKKKGGSKENSRSNTPTIDDNKAQKRKTVDSDSPAAKKSRSASPATTAGGSTPAPSTTVPSSACEGITEDAVRRYLMRKPMTAKDLLQKFKSKNPNIQKDKLVTGIAAMLKKINPEKSKVKDKLFLHIRKT